MQDSISAAKSCDDKLRNTQRICFTNQKGGCGKSSTCFHLAGALAADGHRVLLVDLDPQGSLSQAFFGSAFIERLSLCQTVAAVFAHTFVAPSHLIFSTSNGRIDMVLSNQHLAEFNSPRPENLGMDQYTFRDFLDSQSSYDFVLIDCPPNLYRCNWSAMVAADWVIVPVPPEDFGTQGLRAVHQAIEQARLLNPGLRRLGHLVTRRDSRLIIHSKYEQILRERYGSLILETTIPEASAFKVAVSCKKPVQFTEPNSQAAMLTRQLSHEIVSRIEAKILRRISPFDRVENMEVKLWPQQETC